MERYREQLARTRRYYERFKKLNDGKAQEPSSEANMDDIYAFFQNCYHLKDWLKQRSCIHVPFLSRDRRARQSVA